MKNYRIGDILIRRDGLVSVITREKERLFYLSWLYDYGSGIEMRTLPRMKSVVQSNKFYEKLDV